MCYASLWLSMGYKYYFPHLFFKTKSRAEGPSMASETKPERKTVSVGKQFYDITKGERGRASFIE